MAELDGPGFPVAERMQDVTADSHASGVDDWSRGIQTSAEQSRLAQKQSPSESGQDWSRRAFAV